MTGDPMKRYRVQVRGFPPRTVIARNASAARAAEFRAYREGYPCTFRQFLDLVHVRRARHDD